MRFSNIVTSLSIACLTISLGEFASRSDAQLLKATVRTLTDEEVQTLRDNGELLDDDKQAKDGRILADDDTLKDDFYEEIDFELKLACGAYENIKDGLENAFLSYYDDLFVDYKDCDVPEQNTTDFTLLDWENADLCDSYYRRALEGLGSNNRFINRELKKRKSRGKGRRKGKCNGCKKKRRRRTEETFFIDLSNYLLGTHAQASLDSGRQRQLGGCKADLGKEIQDSGLDGFENAEVTEEVERSAECEQKNSDDCKNSEICCGSPECYCKTPSVSLCEEEGCCIEQAKPFEPDFCKGVGSCGSDPCADPPTPMPTEVPTHNPTESPTDNPTDSPTSTPTMSPTPSPSSFPSAVPSDEPTSSPTPMPTISPSTEPSAAPSEQPTV